MDRHTVQRPTPESAPRHPLLERALVLAALRRRPDVLTHVVCSWLFTGNSELQLPCDQ